MPEKSALVLLDENAEWQGDSKVIAHWTQIDVSSNQISIPLKVEEEPLRIRDEYLSWSHEMGQFKVGDQSLISHLKLFDNLSYWWTTFLVENSHFKYPVLYEIFKIRALELLYYEHECEQLIYCGNDRKLHKTLENWCKEMGHPYRQVPQKNKCARLKTPSIKEWISSFSPWLRALAYLIREWFSRYRHVSSLDSIHPGPAKFKEQITIVTYFPNVDLEKTRKGRFWSKYWEDLHDLLDSMPVTVNWVWLYFNSDEVSFKKTIQLRNVCNQNSSGKHRFYIMEQFLTPRVLLKVLRYYLKIYFTGLRLQNIEQKFYLPRSKLNFFPLLKNEWESSFGDHTAVQGLLKAFQFDLMVQKFPEMKRAIFPWENHSWELALIAAFRRHRKEIKIFAFQHFACLRSLDLRLFKAPEIFTQTGVEAFPLPDKLCIGSPNGIAVMEKSHYPKERIAPVEALRFLNLKGNFQTEKKTLKTSNRTLLVATGLLEYDTQFQLKLLDQAASIGGLREYDRVLIKAHPGRPVGTLLTDLKPYFKYEIVDKPLKKLLSAVDVVYCVNSTGVSLEIAWRGCPLIIAGAINSLNHCPLSEMADIKFATNSKTLCEQLKNPSMVEIPQESLFLDEELKYWKELLKV